MCITNIYGEIYRGDGYPTSVFARVNPFHKHRTIISDTRLVLAVVLRSDIIIYYHIVSKHQRLVLLGQRLPGMHLPPLQGVWSKVRAHYKTVHAIIYFSFLFCWEYICITNLCIINSWSMQIHVSHITFTWYEYFSPVFGYFVAVSLNSSVNQLFALLPPSRFRDGGQRF